MPEINYSIRIVDGNGRPREGLKVFVSYSDWTHDEGQTNCDGWVSFEKGTNIQHWATISKLYVGDAEIDTEVGIEDGDTFSYSFCCDERFEDL